MLALFEFAKKLRTVKFYNKELKWLILICEINVKKLKYHVVWRFFIDTKCEARKKGFRECHAEK